MTPTVSVCVPTYNGARYLRRTVESVLAQSFTDFELVVTDDSSTDDTLAILESIVDPRLRVVVPGTNVGAAANFNRAMEPAIGRYVKLLCQDDILYPDCLGRQVAAMEDGSDAGVVMASALRDVVDGDDRVMWRRRGWRSADGVVDGRQAIRACVRAGTNLIGEPSATLLDRRVVEELGGFDPGLAYPVDLDLWFRMLRRGNLAFVPESLATFRVSTSSWSAALSRDQAREGRELFQRTARDEPGLIRRSDLIAAYLWVTVSAWGRRGVFLLDRIRARGHRPSDEAAVDPAS